MAKKRILLPVPDLAGQLIRLRPWRSDDAATLAAAWRDPDIARCLALPDPRDEAAARRWISGRERAWTQGRSVDLAVVDPGSDGVFGEVGLSSFDTTRRAALIGWWLAAEWRGQGRAREAVRLVVDWVLGEGLLLAVFAEIDCDNPASLAVARHAGLRQVDPGPKPLPRPSEFQTENQSGRQSGGNQGKVSFHARVSTVGCVAAPG